MKLKSIVVAVTFVTPLVFLLLLILVRRAKESPGTPPQPNYPPGITQLLEKWKAAEFVDISDSAALELGIGGMAMEHAPGTATELQQQKLRESVQALLLAYHSGTFDAFRGFRVPIDNFTMTPGVAKLLAKEHKPLPHDPREQFKIYWQTENSGNYSFFKGASFRTAQADIVARTNLIDDLSFQVQQNPNAGLISAGASVEFDETPAKILSQTGRIYYATVAILVKPVGQPYPVWCRFYWSGKHSAWLPLELAAAYSGPRQFTITF